MSLARPNGDQQSVLRWELMEARRSFADWTLDRQGLFRCE